MSSRILVVDDDVALAEMIGIVLQNEGYDVVFCADGSAALAQFQEHNPDLVLLDVMLPGMDGFDVCRAIRRVSDAPIVMLTARSDTSDVVTGLEAGADDYVPKPFKPKELVARVRARLREELLEQVWGYRHAADTRLVNVHVQRLRSKIERDPERPELVVTVRGVGYRAGAGA